jgi:hypothetical protein
MSVSTKGRRAAGAPAQASGRSNAAALRLAKHANQPGADSVYAERRAAEQLALALGGSEPVVRACVAERLFLHSPVAALAAKYGLTPDQVRGILASARCVVAKYTTFFNDDWHWVEGGARTFRVAGAELAL